LKELDEEVKDVSWLKREEPEDFDESRSKRAKGEEFVRGRARVPEGPSSLDGPEKRYGFEGNLDICLVSFGRN
jgi:hypothetical protein